MESTSDYWKPVFYLLEEVVECWLLNARHMRAVPGRKTDMTDAEWICDLIAHGLVRPSFVPPPPIRRLRDLTRRRTSLLADRGREKQRLEKVLEDAGVKLSVLATNLLGKSARDMLAGLVAGERDPVVLAELARARMRTKIPKLREALVGRFDHHHAFLVRMILAHVDVIDAMIVELDARVEAEIEPYRADRDRLDSIDGIDRRGAEVIIAEVGVDMDHFPTSAHLASWAGICPGNNKTGGKSRAAHTRPGNRWLKSALGIASMAAARKKDSYTGAQYRRLAARRGGRRALGAVAHTLLTAAWHILKHKTSYHDLGATYFLTRVDPDRRRRRLVAQLEGLGFSVALTNRAVPAVEAPAISP